VDPNLAVALIEAQFPALAPAHVSRLGEGCDSVAFDLNGEWVFRFPKSDEVARQLEIDARLLPLLGERLPVAVPLFRFHGHPTPGFGRPFVGYQKLPGELFAAEHVLLNTDTQAITGVIDWSDASISDPVVDFVGLCHWGGAPFARAVLDAYDGDLSAPAHSRSPATWPRAAGPWTSRSGSSTRGPTM
jgi:aminoglycoside phosphotransferase (APT) family kinase protein